MAFRLQAGWLAVAALVATTLGLQASETRLLDLQGDIGVPADSALAMFLIGLAVGVPAGIVLFFGYLMMRERAETEQDRELDSLLNAASDREPGAGAWGQHDHRRQSPFEREGTADEQLDPWERPSDWWRHAGDDA